MGKIYKMDGSRVSKITMKRCTVKTLFFFFSTFGKNRNMHKKYASKFKVTIFISNAISVSDDVLCFKCYAFKMQGSFVY